MKSNDNNYNYGECDICNSPLEHQLIKQDFWIKGDLLVIEDIPAGVCPKCGEKVVNAEVGNWVEKLLHNPECIARAPKISVPMIQFSVAANNCI